MPLSGKALAWRGAGYAAFGVGALGAALPVLPTTGPWILAVWCLWKGEDPFARRLLDHPRFGRALRDWFEHGTLSRKGKLAASLGMAGAVGVVFIGGGLMLASCLTAALLAVGAWLWSRPTTAPSVPISQQQRTTTC
jgi:uncharacterized membrane protein YbaN (DUF454 family)